MAEHEQSGQEAARRAAEASRRAQQAQQAQQQRTREATEETRRTAEQFATIGTETLTVWNDIQQKVARDWMQLTSESVQESARMMSDLQQATLSGVQEMQSMTWRWAAMWPEALRDPLKWYERAVGETMVNSRRTLRINRDRLDAVTRSVERMQDTAGQAATTMQETFKEAAGRMQEVAHKVERLRAA